MITDRWTAMDRADERMDAKLANLYAQAKQPLSTNIVKLEFYETLIPPREHLSRSAVFSAMDDKPVVESYTDGKVVNTFLTFKSIPIPLSYFMFFLSLRLAPKQAKNVWGESRCAITSTFRLDEEQYSYLARLWTQADLVPKAKSLIAANFRVAAEQTIKDVIIRINDTAPSFDARREMFNEWIAHIERQYAKSLSRPYVIDPAT